jgi:hypothetical protein
MDEEKEKLEKDLKFLKESYDSEVISEEEYLSGKERIERQMNEVKPKEQKTKTEKKNIEEKPKIEEVNESEKKVEEEEIDEKEIKVEEHKEPEKILEVKDEAEPEKKEPEKEEIQETIPVSDGKEESKAEESLDQEDDVEVIDVNKGSKWKYLVVGLLAIVIIAYLSVPFFSPDEQDEEVDIGLEEPMEFIACSSDNECKEEGKMGFCVDAGTSDSECEFKDVVKTELTVVNTEECFNCGTSRVLNLLKGLYPGLNTNALDYSSDEGNNLINSLGIDVLPAYIFDSNLINTFNFDRTKGAFDGIDDRFAMNKEASGANYFINRETIPIRLDLFLIEGEVSTLKAEQNLQEFLDMFEDKINFTKHSKSDVLTKELEIKTFPTFLINNKIKFTGVQPADKIRENFCQLNELEECSEELRKSLI